MASVLVRAEKSANNRVRLLGHLDRLGKGAEALTETDDELIAFLTDYNGSEEDARRHFGEDAEVEYNAFERRVPNVKEAGESDDFEPLVEIAPGVVVNRSAADREGPPPPPETRTDVAGSPDEGGQPDTATEPSPHMSGAGIAEARRDKQRINADKGDDAAPATRTANRATDSKAKK